MDQMDAVIINMGDVKAKKVNFLWYPYIPYGKITIIQGDPGEGKTTAILQIAAMLTRGHRLPEDEEEKEAINVIYQTAEDGLADTVKPRLEAAGADCSKILVIDESEQSLSMMDHRIEEAIIRTDARLVILDPLQAYLGTNVDMHRANEIRPILKHLGDIAERYDCAIVLIGHMNKASGSKSTYRGLGSIDFQASARSVLIVGRIKDDPTCRVIAHDKSSLAPEGASIAFRLTEDKGVTWEGPIDLTVDELLSGGHKISKCNKAKEFLQEYLMAGPMPCMDIYAEAKRLGIHKRTLDTAKSELGISSKKTSNGWVWSM